MPELAIETHGLTKRFRSQLAVDGLDLAVPRGAVFGFLGPNGSGKTTTIRMLLGLVAATAGDARLLGAEMPRHVDTVLPRVGALVEGPAFSPYLSGTANLRRFDAADRHAPRGSRATRVADALERVGLSHAAEKKVHAYSLGMKQRLGLANALLMRRELLVLDEPTNGLDPQGTREVRSLIRSLADDGTTVFVSSHLLAEVDQVCSHVGVMSAGRLVAQGTLDEFRGGGETRVLVRTPDADRAREVLARLGLELGHGLDDGAAAGGIRSMTDAAGDALVSAALDAPGSSGSSGDAAPAPEAIVAALVAAGVRVRGFELERASLEQRFVELTGEGFDVVQ
ncbi:ABC transporter ATP-binding protein [Agromyces ramosus]|uniref:ABC-2 type transport system ATP-binding protein n=1 Tax=Agromyces ramosus TaxID=33879 RepID=A0ABU0R6Y5_9MICO|nr:ATP-binding cassette domain-containing protein [Agromyces ramosus]MDQ0893828.1 ABC-2 type transport system ATP-binding protein [Agromyces ramosus]